MNEGHAFRPRSTLHPSIPQGSISSDAMCWGAINGAINSAINRAMDLVALDQPPDQAMQGRCVKVITEV